MTKRYTRINYQSSPSTATPLSDTNLNKMDKGIDDIDNAVETLNNNLARLYDLNNGVGYVTNFNDGDNSDAPGRWLVWNASGTAASAPYTGSVGGYVDIVIFGTSVYQTLYDAYGDVYFKKWEQGTSYGTWKKLTN